MKIEKRDAERPSSLENIMTIKLITSFVLAFLFATAFGKYYIPWLRAQKAGQEIKGQVEWHKSKSGTPTMGGVMFILAVTFVCLTVGFEGMLQGNFVHIFVLLFAWVFGLIGFLDDWEKLKKKQNLGLTAKMKFLLQLVAALVFVLLMREIGYVRPNLYIPFSNKVIPMPEWLYFVFASFVIVGTVNAVNITDGIDGLASGTSIPVCLFFVAVTMRWGPRFILSSAFSRPVLSAGSWAFLCLSLQPRKMLHGRHRLALPRRSHRGDGFCLRHADDPYHARSYIHHRDAFPTLFRSRISS